MRNNEKLWKIEKTNENNEKMMTNKEKNNEQWWKIGKNEHNEKMMKNGEKAMKNGEKQETNENNLNDENTIFFFQHYLWETAAAH